MPAEGQPTPATVLKPLRGLQLLTSMLLFHLSSLTISIPEIYMSATSSFMLMVISSFYVCIIGMAIMTLREGDIVRINPTFALCVLGVPVFIIVGVICFVSPMTDSSFWAVKVILLFCFLLAGTFLIEALIVLREFWR